MDSTGYSYRTKYSKYTHGKQEVVAKMQLLGSIMSRSTLANIETGRRNIKASDLKALQMIFDVGFEEFFKD